MVAEWLAWLTSNCGRIGTIGSSPSNGLKPNLWGQNGFNPLCQCVYIYVCIVKPDIDVVIHQYTHTHTHTHTHTQMFVTLLMYVVADIIIIILVYWKGSRKLDNPIFFIQYAVKYVSIKPTLWAFINTATYLSIWWLSHCVIESGFTSRLKVLIWRTVLQIQKSIYLTTHSTHFIYGHMAGDMW